MERFLNWISISVVRFREEAVICIMRAVNGCSVLEIRAISFKIFKCADLLPTTGISFFPSIRVQKDAGVRTFFAALITGNLNASQKRTGIIKYETFKPWNTMQL